MAISNKQKRELTCKYCTENTGRCRCNKKWKDIYREHREEILRDYHEKYPSKEEASSK